MKMLLIATTSAAALFAASAHAECSDMVYSKAATSYIYKDFGTTPSANPVVQAGYLRTCGKWSFGPWVSVGRDRFAKEIDLYAFYDTNAGPLKIQLSGQYYFVNGKGGLLDFKNGLVEVYADGSVPITLGRLTVAPMLRGVQTVGVKNFGSLTLVQPGIRASFALSKKVSFTADLRDSVNLTQGYSTIRFDGNIAWKVGAHDTLKGEYEDTDRTGKVISVNFVHGF